MQEVKISLQIGEITHEIGEKKTLVTHTNQISSLQKTPIILELR